MTRHPDSRHEGWGAGAPRAGLRIVPLLREQEVVLQAYLRVGHLITPCHVLVHMIDMSYTTDVFKRKCIYAVMS